MATPPQLNSRISLVSRSNIRYEGILYSIDLTTDSNPTIALSNVRSFGTENRQTDKHVPSSDEVYEYIIFRGSDIQELTMIERPQPVHHTMLNDPAIINSGMVPSYAQNNYMGYGFGNQNYMGMGMGMGQHYYNPYYMNNYYGMYGSQHVNPQQAMDVPVGFDQHLPNSHKIPQFQEPSTRGQISAQPKSGLQPPSNQNASAKVNNPTQPSAGAPTQFKNQNAASVVSPVPTPTIAPTPVSARVPSSITSAQNPPNLVENKEIKTKDNIIPSLSTQNNHQAAQNTQNQPKNPPQSHAKDLQPKIEQQSAPQTFNPTTKPASPEQRKNSNNQNKGGRGGKMRWQEKGNGEKQDHRPTNNYNENHQGGRGGRGGNRGGRMHRGGRGGGGRINPGRTKMRYQEFDFDKNTELFNKEKEMKEIENEGQQQLLQEREVIVSAAANLASNLSKQTDTNNDDLHSLDITVAYNPSTSIFDTLSCDTFDRIHSKKSLMDKKTRQKTRQDQKKMDEETFGPNRNPGRFHQNRNNNNNNNRGRGQKRVFRPVQKEKTTESIESRNE